MPGIIAAESQYPAGATPVAAASGNVANASAVATIPAVAGRTAYLTGFAITSTGATAPAVVSPTVTGLISTTLTYTYAVAAGATTANALLTPDFALAMPASAVNTAIVVTLPALGAGNTNATVVARGYYL